MFRFGVLRKVQILLHTPLHKNHYFKRTGQTDKRLAGLPFMSQG